MKYKIKKFVVISTDKAVYPSNIMGDSKRLCEKFIQQIAKSSSGTNFSIVRFGNVAGSKGSVIPLFQKLINQRLYLPVTNKKATRYLMSIREASGLIIKASIFGSNSKTYVLDMGEPVKIVELAKRLINLSGMDLIDEKNPEGDIEIIFTGLRPGEKLYEELLIGGNVSPTEHKKILKAQEESLSSNELEN